MLPSMYEQGFTDEMYEGNEPAFVDNEAFAVPTYKWITQYGQGNTGLEKELYVGCFDLNQYNSVRVIGDRLVIIHFASDSSRYWKFSNAEVNDISDTGRDKIVKVLNSKNGCEYWKIIQHRAKELFLDWYKDHCNNEYGFEIIKDELCM